MNEKNGKKNDTDDTVFLCFCLHHFLLMIMQLVDETPRCVVYCYRFL
jgi:hypothetical protein